MRIVKVIWDDATSNTGEYPADDVMYECTLTETVGILGIETEEGIVIFTDYVPSLNEYRCKHTIPKGMIKEIKFLSEWA